MDVASVKGSGERREGKKQRADRDGEEGHVDVPEPVFTLLRALRGSARSARRPSLPLVTVMES